MPSGLLQPVIMTTLPRARGEVEGGAMVGIMGIGVAFGRVEGGV